MAAQADGSIIVDTEINPEGFKAGSSELLAAIKSLSSEVKELGKILKETFSNNSQSIGGTDSSVQQLEATIASLKEEVQSLQSKVAELQERLNNLGNSKEPQTPVDGIATAAQNADGQIAALEAKIKGLESVIASLQTQLENATATPAEANIDISEAESKIAALETRIQELEAELSSAQSGQATPAPQADFSGPVQSASALQRSIDSVSNSVTNLEPTFQKAMSGSESAMTSFQTKAGALETKIATLREKLEAMGNTKTPTAEYKALSAETERAGVKLENLLNRQERMQAMGVKENSAQWKNLQYDLDLAAQKYDQLAAAKARMETSGTAFTVGSQTAEYAQMVSQINAAESALSSMQAQAARVEGRANGIGAAFRRVVTAIGTAAKTVGGALLNGLKGVLSVTKKIIVGNKNYKKSFSGITSIIKRVGLGLLGCRGVYMILRKAVTAYMEANQGLANQLSSCWTSLGNLLGPLITKIINLVSTAIAYVTAFLKLLGITGSAASDAVEGAGGAAEKAQKSLTGFDEINALQDNSSGGGGGGGAGSTPLPEATLPDWTKLMIDQIKAGDWVGAATTLTTELNAMVASVDWAGVGNKIGYYLNGALTFLATAILTFDWIALGSDLATSLNGIIANVDWGNLAVILASKLIILLQTLTGFFETLDGAEFGNAIHEFITGGINAVDWVGATGRLAAAISDFIMAIDFGQLGTDLSNGFKTMLNSITSAVTNFDWRGLGSQIADFINGIDWGGIIADTATMVGEVLSGALDLLIGFAEDLDWAKLGNDLWNGLVSLFTNIDWGGLISQAFQLLGAALGGATQLIWTILQNLWDLLVQAWDGTKSYFTDHINAAGGDIIQGLWNGICEAFANVGTWIVENIWDPFIEGFCNAFGIASPSTKMAEQGDFIVQGLLQGITDAWNSITEFFNTALSTITTSLSTAWNNIKTATSTTWENIKTSLGTTWNNLKTSASTTWNNIKTSASTAWTNIKSTASSTWSNIKSSLSTTWNNMKTTASTTWNSMKSSASTTWTNMKSTATTTWNSIKSSLSTTWNNIKSTASTTWSGIKNTIQNQGWSGIGSNIASGIKTGISNGWSTLTNWVKEKAKSLLNAAKSALGIHSPSRLFRDEVGLNIGLGIGEGVEGSEKSVLNSVAGVADAIAAEFNAGEYKVGNIIPAAEIDGAITSFTDKITDSFTALMEKMDAIAKRVTFNVPAFAGSVVPYRAAAGSGGVTTIIEEANDELAKTMEYTSNRQIVLLREQNNLLRQLLEKDIDVTAVIGTDDIVNGLSRKNRRDGKTVVPVGA